MVLLSVEKYYFRGAEGYETARRATVWNGLLPDRFPDVIVQAHDTDDVVAAIRYARANGHKSAYVRAGTAGRPVTCATVACFSTSAASITALSNRIG